VTPPPSHDQPDAPTGAALLDAVALMDRLRSPGGCAWDAAQDHASLAPYLLEEAYEVFQTIEDGDSAALRDELGDVLLQVLFHARIAEELPEGERWTVDDVANGLIAKLTRRHPHVFAGADAPVDDEVDRTWDQLKAAERAGASPLASVPMSMPSLTLAAKLQRKADLEPAADPQAVTEAAEGFAADPSEAAAGELLWQVVSALRAAGIDPEAALRARSRAFRDAALAAFDAAQA
jgi:XTP/dITP diphosphohydrolase